MSRVRRLSIMGIRNFGDEQEEVIRFTRPLTLIIGQNGVGKTTIIEALRYATTGEFPPGSDRGKGFVHDPMLKKTQTNVRGKVKAEFIDTSGTITTVTRVMEATRSDSGIRFKTVDSTIDKMNNKTKQNYSTTNRCVDVDKEMKASLGLSTAILNNVIFCHQDDSNWPMDDSKKLKERFDEIFDTTRYNKALELIRKDIKQKQIEIRNLNIEINAQSVIVEEVNAKELKLVEYQSRRLETAQIIEKIIEKLEPVKRKISDIKNVETRFNELNIEAKKFNVELVVAEQNLQMHKSAIKQFFDGSDDDLLNALKSYDDDLGDKNKKINEITSELESLSDKERKITKTLGEQKVQTGSFKFKLENQEKKIRERNEMLNQILKEFNMETINSDTSAGSIQSLVEDIEFNLEYIETAISNTQKEHDKEENEFSKRVESFKNERMKIDVELKRREKELLDTKDNLQDVRNKIAKSVDAEKKLDAVDKKLASINKSIQQATDEMAETNIANKINDEMSQLEKIEDDYNKTDKLIVLLQNQNELKVKFETLKTELNRKHEEADKLQNKHGKVLEDLLGTNIIPKKDLKNTVNKMLKNFNDRLTNLRHDISQEQNKATSLDTTIQHSRQEYRAKIAEIECDKKKVSLCGADYKNYDQALLLTDKNLKSLQNKRGMFAYQGAAYTEYTKKLTDPKPCCPVCERDFSSMSEASKVAARLNTDLLNHPERLKKCEDELNLVKSKHESLLALQTTVEKIIKFEEVDKDKILAEMKDNQVKLAGIRKKIDELQTLIRDIEAKIALCNSLSGDLAIWDQCLNDIERLTEGYDIILVEMDEGNFNDNKSMEDVNNDRELLKQRKKEIQDKIACMRKELDMENDKLQRTKDSKSRILEEQLKIHDEVQKIKQWRENLNELTSKEAKLRNTIQNLRQRLITAQNELDDEFEKFEDLKMCNREKLEKERKKFIEYTKQVDKLKVINVDVINLQAQKIEFRMQELEKEMHENEKRLHEIKKQSDVLKKLYTDLKEDISSAELKKRNLSDNYEYRKNISTINKIKDANEKTEQEMKKLNIEEARKDFEFFQRKAEKQEREINMMRGRENELGRTITQLEEELTKEEYCTAKNKHQEKFLELKVNENVVSDLQAYAKSVDHAMTNYHEERMNTVNKSMKNLWSLIYTGTDTTSIQIKTDAASGTAERRIFNYKLVQVKHGVEMDMRGRCSAGQRVLASIVIRLALAETFCEQCGMIALDEPTTNLDAGNAASLADTLFNYVRLRAAYQKNFQLIVITHDEQFTHKLSELNSTHGFYELYRNSEGLTSIQYLVFEGEHPRRRNNNRETQSDTEDTVDDATNDQNDTSKKNNKKRVISPSASTSTSKKPFKFTL